MKNGKHRLSVAEEVEARPSPQAIGRRSTAHTPKQCFALIGSPLFSPFSADGDAVCRQGRKRDSGNGGLLSAEHEQQTCSGESTL